MYDPTRLTHPIKRVGERGSGRWQRITWDQAFDEIADTYLDVTIKEGTDRTIWDTGPSVNLGATHACQARFAQLTHSITLDSNPADGDGHHGVFETFGKFTMDRSLDDYFYSDLILIWGGNPLYTQIPNAHFFTEARYNGTRLVVISPDYSPSAIKADLWVPVKPGTDAALALAICRIIIEEGKVNEAFVTEQTDLPFLVRSDTRKFLTEADIKKDGETDRYVIFDKSSQGFELAPNRKLALGGLTPELDGRRIAHLHDGKEVEVRSVFSLLRERLAPYTAESAAVMCGTPVTLIRRFAADIIKAKAMSNVAGSSVNKYYHGNLTGRAMVLIFALLGHMGRHGAGFSAFSLLNNDGFEKYVYGLRWKERIGFFAEFGPGIAKKLISGGTMEMFFRDVASESFTDPGKAQAINTSSYLFWNVHGGVIDLADNAKKWIPELKRTVKVHLKESLDKKWFPLQPAPDRPPRIMFHYASNSLRAIRGSHKILDVLWPKLKLIVAMDWRMNTTTRNADIVLPASTWYERTDHKWVTPLMPFSHVTVAATKPSGESQDDFWIITMMAKHIQKRAKERGITSITSHLGKEIHLDRLYDDLTMDGKFAENDIEKAARTILELSSNLDHVDWDEHKRLGFAKYRGVGNGLTSISNMGDMPEGETFAPLTYHVRDKQPYPTATRRMQFYLDHELHLEYDETLPCYKEPPKIGGDYPLMMTGGKARWSIHGTWRDSRIMLRLERGGPCLFLAPKDAAARKIKDGDWIRAWNDVGSFNVRAKLAPSLRPGQALMYQEWEQHQFLGKGNMNVVSPSPIKPVELAGGHPHLRIGLLEGQPGGFDRDTRIDVAPLSAQEVKRLKRAARVS
ncbi:MAG: molybdopterin-dependent oxidoreductase [Burkholderiales bacterium]|nr:molybdopterin-dependent oxidoreductase [Burkholderiales bacterium]